MEFMKLHTQQLASGGKALLGKEKSGGSNNNVKDISTTIEKNADLFESPEFKHLQEQEKKTQQLIDELKAKEIANLGLMQANILNGN